MVSFATLDLIIIVSFFIVVIGVGFYASKNQKSDNDSFLLSGRKVGLLLFILTNVATWYGGILGVGEFTYRYGLASWFTQGFPYYVFAILFALFLAPKIRSASLFTIPEKLAKEYNPIIGKISAVLIFILVSPAPYLLMIGYLISLIFDISIFWSLIIGIIVSTIYLFKGGYKSNITTDALQFFVMFIGFFILFFVAITNLGGIEYLDKNLPKAHLTLSGGNSPIFIIVWFLIATWTFTDPGFHQRCYSAKNNNVAKYGILVSVVLWALFDFLTTSTGLFARAAIAEISNPMLAFPLLAESLLGSGLKGIFYAGLFATILSTLNSFMFLSATTLGRDFLHPFFDNSRNDKSIYFTRIGLVISAFVAFLLAFYFDSVVDMWYTIGSICIPGILLLIISSYYPKLKISNLFALLELLTGILVSLFWFFIRYSFAADSIFIQIEPMIIGLASVVLVHSIGFLFKKKNYY